ncbi:MAG: hypothetical protein ACPGUE_07525 [Marinomonas sp.]
MNLSDKVSKAKSKKQAIDKIDGSNVKKKIDMSKVKDTLNPQKIKAKLKFKKAKPEELKGMLSFNAGQFSLEAGESIETKTRILSMQGDGNLVLYKKDSGTISKAFWASGTNQGSGYRTIFQGDGNLVIYDAKGKAKWASGTHPNGNRIIMQSDGNLVIYLDIGKALWATGTN